MKAGTQGNTSNKSGIISSLMGLQWFAVLLGVLAR